MKIEVGTKDTGTIEVVGDYWRNDGGNLNICTGEKVVATFNSWVYVKQVEENDFTATLISKTREIGKELKCDTFEEAFSYVTGCVNKALREELQTKK